MSTMKTLTATIFVLLALSHEAHAQNSSRYTVVSMHQTPLTREELAKALKEGHVDVFGAEPSDNRLAMGWAQVALENGHGRYVWNHNLGNVAAWAAGQTAYYNPGDGNYYKDFHTFKEGAAAYWSTVKRCARAMVDFDAGDGNAAAAHLKQCNYYQAPVAPYARMLTDLYGYFKRSILPGLNNERQLKEDIQRLIGTDAASPA